MISHLAKDMYAVNVRQNSHYGRNLFTDFTTYAKFCATPLELSITRRSPSCSEMFSKTLARHLGREHYYGITAVILLR